MKTAKAKAKEPIDIIDITPYVARNVVVVNLRRNYVCSTKVWLGKKPIKSLFPETSKQFESLLGSEGILRYEDSLYKYRKGQVFNRQEDFKYELEPLIG